MQLTIVKKTTLVLIALIYHFSKAISGLAFRELLKIQHAVHMKEKKLLNFIHIVHHRILAA